MRERLVADAVVYGRIVIQERKRPAVRKTARLAELIFETHEQQFPRR